MSGLKSMKERAVQEMGYAVDLFDGLENGSMVEAYWYILGLLDCIEMMTGVETRSLIEQLCPEFIKVWECPSDDLAKKGTR